MQLYLSGHQQTLYHRTATSTSATSTRSQIGVLLVNGDPSKVLVTGSTKTESSINVFIIVVAMCSVYSAL